IFRVKCVEVSVWDGRTSERSGIKSTSSNVSPSKISGVIILATNNKRLATKKHIRHKTDFSILCLECFFVAIHVGTSGALRGRLPSKLRESKLPGPRSEQGNVWPACLYKLSNGAASC